jgi:16S rRNA (guanine(1405)-N(7))-methyltransferase
MDADSILKTVLEKPSYQSIHSGFINRILEQEIQRRNSSKEVLKAVLSRLHQLTSGYLVKKTNYDSWVEELGHLPHDLNSPHLRNFCTQKMREHASTRERIPILENFFQQTLSSLAPIQSMLDVGCGLNPLAIPWMLVNSHVKYMGVDIFGKMIDFLNHFIKHVAIQGEIICGDILKPDALKPAQLVLALKMLPLLEKIEKGISQTWLDSLPAEHVLVSYPIASLSGRSKGMRRNYANQFAQLIQGKKWKVQLFDFPSELAFLIHK